MDRLWASERWDEQSAKEDSLEDKLYWKRKGSVIGVTGRRDFWSVIGHLGDPRGCPGSLKPLPFSHATLSFDAQSRHC